MVNQRIILARDDFTELPVGPIHEDHSPAREYHVIEPPWDRGIWREATVHHSWSHARATWRIVNADGGRALEQGLYSTAATPIVVTGENVWREYEVRVEVRPLSLAGPVGVIVGYQNSRCFIAAQMERGRLSLVRRAHEETEVLASVEQEISADHYSLLAVALQAGLARARLGDGPEIEAPVGSYDHGKVGLLAQVPARFRAFEVTTPAAAYSVFTQELSAEQRELAELREQYPEPVQAHSIETRGFGSDRNLRFGDLNGDGRLEIVIGQKVDRIDGGNFPMISCLTAIDLDGNVLWQIGEPNREHTHATADLCFQVSDINGDAKAEVLFCRDFLLQIADGETGKIIDAVPTPLAAEPDSFVGGPYFERVSGDSIYLADLRGLGAPRDIVLKNRYGHFWVFDEKLQLQWNRACNTGHFPASYDIDGDGREELMVGYSLFDHDGGLIFDLGLPDHADGIAIGNFGTGELRIALAGGEAGFVLCTPEGEILARHRFGHVQKLTAAKLRADLEGVQFFTVTYWGYPGVAALMDCCGNVVMTFQPMHYASAIPPVNWRGDPVELILLSTHPVEGGMIDGHGRRVVMFPDDGHPVLCSAALDLFGSGRDNVLTWDERRIVVYAPAGDAPEAVYRPLRNQFYNESNYKAHVSLPG